MAVATPGVLSRSRWRTVASSPGSLQRSSAPMDHSRDHGAFDGAIRPASSTAARWGDPRLPITVGGTDQTYRRAIDDHRAPRQDPRSMLRVSEDRPVSAAVLIPVKAFGSATRRLSPA